MPDPILRLPPYFPNFSVRKMARPINYGIEMIGAPVQWTKTRGKGVRIAVLDTGKPNHRDLPNIVAAKNFTNSDTVDAIEPHAWHVSGIVAASAFDPATGLTGVAPEASLVIGKVLGDDGSGSASWLDKGIQWAVEEEGASILNLSLGAPPEAEPGFKAVRRTMERLARPSRGRGAIFFVAAGNEYGPLGIPARWDSCISIGAVDKNRARAEFSNFGVELRFVAPGVDIWSTWPGNRYNDSTGTSMAVCFGAGMGALILSEHDDGLPHATPISGLDDMMEHLSWIAVDLGKPGHDVEYGNGMPVFLTSQIPEPPKEPAPLPEPIPSPIPIPPPDPVPTLPPLPEPPAPLPPAPEPIPPRPPDRRMSWLDRLLDWLLRRRL